MICPACERDLECAHCARSAQARKAALARSAALTKGQRRAIASEGGVASWARSKAALSRTRKRMSEAAKKRHRSRS